MPREYDFKAFDGKSVHVYVWNEVSKPLGMVQICHGMAEHALRYDRFARYLNENGFIVFADDHRGHGKTDAEHLGYSDGDMFFDTLNDEVTLSDKYRQLYPRLPLVLLGHSYGSFVTQAYLMRYADRLSGVVLMGSAKMDSPAVAIGHLMAKSGKPKEAAEKIKRLTFDKYNKKLNCKCFVSSIDEEAERYLNDPYCNFVCSNAFYESFFRGLKTLYKKRNLKKLRVDLPMLIVSGASDPVGGYGRSVKRLYSMYRRRGVKKIGLKLFDGCLHEPLNDTAREQCGEAIKNFCLEAANKPVV